MRRTRKRTIKKRIKSLKMKIEIENSEKKVSEKKKELNLALIQDKDTHL
jgi:hypothetical protein